MTTSSSCFEEGFNLYWKIKNFSYCCEAIKSPEFILDLSRYFIELNVKSPCVGEQCQLFRRVRNRTLKAENFEEKISFLTCDGSPDLSISGCVDLKGAIFGSRRNAFLPEDTLTVRFRDPNSSCKKGKLFICSQIGVNRKHFLWTFKDCSKGNLCKIRLVEISEIYGNVGLHLETISENDDTEQFGIAITRSCGERCYCVVQISMVEVGGKAVNEVRDEFIFEKEETKQARAFPMIIKKSELIASKNLLLPNDTLTLKCSLAVSLGKIENGTSVMSNCENDTVLQKEMGDISMSFKGKTARSNGSSLTELQTDLKCLLADRTLHDASLHIGSEVFQVHKAILGARSLVFRTMFTRDTNTNTALIEDLDVETVRALLLYIYTDTINAKQWDSMMKLFLAAVKYEVPSLKKKCISFLKVNLSVSNVCEALALSDLHRDEDLKSAVIDFISDCDSEVYDTEEWKRLEKSNFSLAFEISGEVLRKLRIGFS